MRRTIWVGYDMREAAAWMVAYRSLVQHTSAWQARIYTLVIQHLRERGLYWRETDKVDGQLWDVISNAPMSTEFAISRFLVPELVYQTHRPDVHGSKKGWALFMDCDMLVRGNLRYLFDMVEMHPDKAVFCVHHHHVVDGKHTKMDNQAQVPYARKNWSSVMLFNCDHPSNVNLSVDLVNTLPGRDLHRFCWLKDEEIGEIPIGYNYLVGETKSPVPNPFIAHFTLGPPYLPGYENQEFADEWWAQLYRILGVPEGIRDPRPTPSQMVKETT